MTDNKVKKKETRGCKKKYTKEYIEKIAKDLDEWSHNDRALFLEGFMAQHKTKPQDDNFYDWKKENEIFRETLINVKKRLIDRLRTKSCFKEIDGGFVSKVLPLVDLDYRKWRQFELSKEKEDKNQKIEVVVKHGKSKEKN